MSGFLPIKKEELKDKNEQLDFVYISGDAYVDHPSFGTAIISRLLESYGYSVGIIPQPDWKDDKSITEFGEPRLAFLVLPETWTPWLTTIQFQRKGVKQITILPVVLWVNALTMQQLYIAI